MPAWHIQTARITAFLAPDSSVSPSIWMDLIGEDSAESVYKKASAAHDDSGPFAEGKLTIQRQPTRIDFRHEPAPGPTPHQFLGSFPDGARPLLELSRRWLSGSAPSIVRMALGLVLVSDEVADVEAGYRELGTLVDGAPTQPGATDFHLQVNLPRDSTHVAGLRINRLSKWSVGGYFEVATGRLAAVTQLVHIHLRAELDVNTNPEFAGPFGQEQAMSVLDELLVAAGEIAERGTKL